MALLTGVVTAVNHNEPTGPRLKATCQSVGFDAIKLSCVTELLLLKYPPGRCEPQSRHPEPSAAQQNLTYTG